MSEISNIAEHTHAPKHTFDFDKFEILSSETNCYQGIIKESSYTKVTYEKSLNDVKYKLKIFG